MKRIILGILLSIGFIILNDRAALYQRQLIPPLKNYLPFNLKTYRYNLEYHLLDKEKYFRVGSKNQFPIGYTSKEKEKIYIKKITSIYWTDDRLIVEVILKKGRKLIEIKAKVYDSGETIIEDYYFVKDETLKEMDDKVSFDKISIVMRIWPLLGLLYLISIFYIIFNKKVAKLLGD